MDKIDLAIQQVMSSVFDLPLEQIDKDASQDTIKTWDSLRHLDLIVSLEEEFGIIIPIEEVGSMVSFGLIKVIVNEQLVNEGKSY